MRRESLSCHQYRPENETHTPFLLLIFAHNLVPNRTTEVITFVNISMMIYSIEYLYSAWSSCFVRWSILFSSSNRFGIAFMWQNIWHYKFNWSRTQFWKLKLSFIKAKRATFYGLCIFHFYWCYFDWFLLKYAESWKPTDDFQCKNMHQTSP